MSEELYCIEGVDIYLFKEYFISFLFKKKA